MYFHTYIRFFVFFARSTAADNFRTLCDGSKDDRRRQQQQQCREHAATSWLQCYTTCCIAHSCFYRTLGSVIEDRAGTCELLLLLLSAWSAVYSSAVLLLCCPAAIYTGSRSSSKAADILCTRYQALRTGPKNRSYEYTNVFSYYAPGMTYTYKNQTRHQVTGTRYYQACFQTSNLRFHRDHSNYI